MIDLATLPFISGDEYENECFVGSLPEPHIAEDIRLKHSRLTKAGLNGATLTRLNLTSVRLERCSAVSAGCYKSAWHAVSCETCRLTGLKAAESVLRDCEFKECALNLASFRFSNLRNVTFNDCNLRGTDFSNAVLKNVTFKACDLGEAEFNQARMSAVDLRGADLTGVAGIAHLNGAIISSDQLMRLAGSLAEHHGIRVDDEL